MALNRRVRAGYEPRPVCEANRLGGGVVLWRDPMLLCGGGGFALLRRTEWRRPGVGARGQTLPKVPLFSLWLGSSELT